MLGIDDATKKYFYCLYIVDAMLSCFLMKIHAITIKTRYHMLKLILIIIVMHHQEIVGISAHVKEMPDYSHRQRANYTVIAYGSPDLQHYFHKEITSLIYNATIQNHCCALPGYSFLMVYVVVLINYLNFQVQNTVLISYLKTLSGNILYSYRKCFV